MVCARVIPVLFIGVLIRLAESATGQICASPNSPANGLVRCSKDGSMVTCVGTCNTGFKFELGESSITKVCNELSTLQTTFSPFPKCIKSTCLSSLVSSVNDSKISASSVWNGVKGYYFGPERARMSSRVEVKDGVVQSGGWRSSINTLDQYIQVELSSVKRIMGVVTKGRAVSTGDTAQEFVTRYRMLYSKDGSNWQPYSTKTVIDQFLDGNTDSTSAKVNMFVCPFNARFIRINPLAWHQNIAMRFDLLGCDSDGTEPACTTDTTTVPSFIPTTQTPTIKVPTPPQDLCSPIPPPQNGNINCETMGDRLVCVANCQDNYIFETKELLIKRVCMRHTGVWPSTAAVPRCIYNQQVVPVPTKAFPHGCVTSQSQCDSVGNGDFHACGGCHFFATDGCVTSQSQCDSVGNGDFQACGGCHFFATCSEGFLYVRACPENLVYDEVSKVCDYHSRTCPDA